MLFDSRFLPLLIAGRIALGAIFLLASIPKIVWPSAFADVVESYRLLPGPLIRPVGRLLPGFELAIGIGLTSGFRPRLLLPVAVVVFLTFGSAVVIKLLQGERQIPCGCFAARGRFLSWSIVVRNLSLSGLGLVLFFADDRRASTSTTDIVSAACLGVGLVALSPVVGTVLRYWDVQASINKIWQIGRA